MAAREAELRSSSRSVTGIRRATRYVYSDRASMLTEVEPMIRGLMATEREELEPSDVRGEALAEMDTLTGGDLLDAWLNYQSEYETVDEALEVDEGISR